MSHPIVHRIGLALQCAATLVALLLPVALIAWLTGIADTADLSCALAGVFGGSLAMGLIKGQSKPHRDRRAAATR
jgi:hypothetical protein